MDAPRAILHLCQTIAVFIKVMLVIFLLWLHTNGAIFYVILHALQTALRHAIIETRKKLPFKIDAWVILPDHMHCIWTMPDNDGDYSKRWSMIKRLSSKQCPQYHMVTHSKRQENGIWQRRFWEHTIRDDNDYERHMDYVHYNPVKHGYVQQVKAWQFSSFHRLVKQGVYDPDWGSDVVIDDAFDFGE